MDMAIAALHVPGAVHAGEPHPTGEPPEACALADDWRRQIARREVETLTIHNRRYQGGPMLGTERRAGRDEWLSHVAKRLNVLHLLARQAEMGGLAMQRCAVISLGRLDAPATDLRRDYDPHGEEPLSLVPLALDTPPGEPTCFETACKHAPPRAWEACHDAQECFQGLPGPHAHMVSHELQPGSGAFVDRFYYQAPARRVGLYLAPSHLLEAGHVSALRAFMRDVVRLLGRDRPDTPLLLLGRMRTTAGLARAVERHTFHESFTRDYWGRGEAAAT